MASNPFDKVIQMIKDLVAKLKEEAAAEAEHKAWCDEQLKSNKIKVEKKTSKVNKLTATVESLTETIKSMGEKIAPSARSRPSSLRPCRKPPASVARRRPPTP